VSASASTGSLLAHNPQQGRYDAVSGHHVSRRPQGAAPLPEARVARRSVFCDPDHPAPHGAA